MDNSIKNFDINSLDTENIIVAGWTLQHILDNGGIILRNINDQEKLFVAYMDTNSFIISPIEY